MFKKSRLSLIAILWVSSLAFSFATDNSLTAISKRIQPIGKVNVEKIAAPATTAPNKVISDVGKLKEKSTAKRDGKIIYTAHCQLCHNSGAAGAPKLNDTQTWKARNKQGLATLVAHVIDGYKLMPPKGGCAQCTDEEIKAAVEYMIKQANKS